MNFDEVDIPEFSLRAIDEIWDQWNQSNDLFSGMNLPSSHKQRQNDSKATTEVRAVYDAEFKYLYEVPSHLLVHVPSARLNITRLVFCRNYRSFEADSCKMGNNCKFVHADVDVSTLEAFPIHVNYIWRDEKLCTYKRLPPGEFLEVLSSDMCTVETLPSERILLTRGALAHQDIAEPLIRCKHYDANQTCFTGERCNFVHVMYVDPNCQGSFKRAPKAIVEARGNATNASTKMAHHNTTTNQNNSRGNNKNNNNGNFSNHMPENLHDAQASNLNWAPHVNFPPFDQSGLNSMVVLQDLNNGASFGSGSAMPCQDAGISTGVLGMGCLMPSLASNGRQATQPSSFHCDKTEGSLQELLKMLQVSQHPTSYGALSANAQSLNGTAGPQQISDGNISAANNTGLTQEQLSGVLSPVFSLLAQRVSSSHTFSVGSSPLLEEPRAVGTLLFLPRGATEAVAIQPVYDTSFLGAITALGSQQQRSAQAVVQKSPSSMSRPTTTSGGGTSQNFPFPFVSPGNGNMNLGGLVTSGGGRGSNGVIGGGGGGGSANNSISTAGPTADYYTRAFEQLQGALNGNSAWMRGV
ncbi:Zinc finger CCCH domain-containing protein 35 [Trypanosoma cruzi]|nr:Zinc finger CCCH domain-containing protein 35 [Trypanosoma cruzi]